MSRNIVDENGNLIQIAGKGVGVAEWGTPIENWLTNATSVESAKLADKDGILVHSDKADSNSTRSMKVYDNDVQIYLQTNNYGKTCTIPIIKGHKYYYTSENGTIESSIFYPFKTNNDLQMVREKYSTEETVIGEWIDGKPIYRRVLKNTSPITTNVWSWGGLDTIINSMNINQFIHCYRTLKTDTETSIREIRVSKAINGDNGFLTLGNNAAIGTEIILEYTKTTD